MKETESNILKEIIKDVIECMGYRGQSEGNLRGHIFKKVLSN